LEPELAHGKRKSGVFFGLAPSKADQASKTKTGAGKSGGREQKLGTMKAASELQKKTNKIPHMRAAHHKHTIKW
jgi:hypothetical protein